MNHTHTFIISGIELTVEILHSSDTMYLLAPPNNPGRRALEKVSQRHDIEYQDVFLDDESKAQGSFWTAQVAPESAADVLKLVPTPEDLNALERDARTALNILPISIRLEVAKSIVASIRRNLNNSYHDCSECESPVYENWTEHKMHLLMESTFNRLEKAADLARLRDKTK